MEMGMFFYSLGTLIIKDFLYIAIMSLIVANLLKLFINFPIIRK